MWTCFTNLLLLCIINPSYQQGEQLSLTAILQAEHRATCLSLSEPSFSAACKAASASQVARSKSAAV